MSWVDFLDKHYDATWWLLFWFAAFKGFCLVRSNSETKIKWRKDKPEEK